MLAFHNRRFGYPNREALAEGKTGIECRGEEHEVVIVWSVTSGKRQIMMDGKEVHYSMNRTGILDHSWTARGNHILKIHQWLADTHHHNIGNRTRTLGL